MHPATFNETISDAVKRVAQTVVKDCMGIKPGETVLVVTDGIRKDLGTPIYQAASSICNDAIYMEMKPRKLNGEEPPQLIAEAMLNADVILAVTTVSLTHTQAKKNALKHGARIATMPFGFKSSEFVMREFTQGGMTVDFKKMDENIHRLANKLNGTKQAHITTEKGTDIVIDYEGRIFHEDTGIAHYPGDFTNLPAGELYIAPVNANGTIVIDVSLGRLGRLNSPITLEVKDGYAGTITGERSEELKNILDPYGPKSRNIAELGIGMNPNAHICGLLVEDEKVGNTVHIALGSNSSFGGDVSAGVHLDGVIDRPTLYVDNEKIELDQYL